MTIRVPFQLRRRSSGGTAPAEALFVPGRDAAVLLSACMRLGLEPSGRVHDVAGGFLVRLAGASTVPVPGATRLREPSKDLFVPVDAELVPALLTDEAAGLVRDGGLVFLPGGRVLRFDRQAPIELAALLDVPTRPGRPWGPMPEPRPLAARIVEVAREWPEPPAEDLYRELEQDLRRPRRPGPAERPQGDAGGRRGGEGEGEGDLEGAADGEAGGGGSGGGGLGAALRSFFGRAGSGARSLRESFTWGMLDHSGLVRKLLREFRQGDAEQALRHALPMSPAEPGSGSRMVPMGNSLPFSRAIYNLLDLLGGSSRGGTVGVWDARPDLVEELKREYRAAAERALRRGDFRRAAYIYGKLLGDHRMAAQALQRGGLHHDAAILYLKKLDDKAAAAQAFEAAGMVDRAIALYRGVGRHEAAGDLLRRIGDEVGAKDEYVRASIQASEGNPPDWLEAGRILSRKAGLMPEAVAAYRCGWLRRPAPNATACALELVAIHAPRGDLAPLSEILDEADALYRSAGYENDAGKFYNRMAAAVAAVGELSAFAEEVHDRARLALADQLRRKAEAGQLGPATVSSLFAEPRLWSPAFLRDAQFAAAEAAAARKAQRAIKAVARPQPAGILVARGEVRAACQASTTAHVFLASADGQIVAFLPGQNRVVPVGEVARGVTSMAVDPNGEILVALRQDERGASLHAFSRRPDGSFRGGEEILRTISLRSWLTPMLSFGAEAFVGLADERELCIVEVPSGLTPASIPFRSFDESPVTAFLLPDGEETRVVTHDGMRWVVLDTKGERVGLSSPAWRPCFGGRGPRCWVPVNWTYLDGVVRVVGLDSAGSVHASQFWVEPWPTGHSRPISINAEDDQVTRSPRRPDDNVLELLASPTASIVGGYLAAAATAPDRVVAVSAGRVDWLREASDRFRTVHSLEAPDLRDIEACFPSTSADEVLVVLGDGRIARVEVPRGSGSRMRAV